MIRGPISVDYRMIPPGTGYQFRPVPFSEEAIAWKPTSAQILLISFPSFRLRFGMIYNST